LPLPLSSWPFSWSRTFLFLIVMCTALGAAMTYAAPPASTTGTAMALNDKQESYDAVAHIYHTRDPGGDLGAREIYLRHRNNLRGERLPPGPINLSFDPVPHWLIFDIVNNSHKSDWALDFGNLMDGR